MLKIDRRRSSGDLKRVGTTGSGVGVGRVEKSSGSEFSRDLVDKQSEAHQQRMQELLHQIDELSGRLAANLNLSDLMRYKGLVRDFIREATARAYLVQQEKGWVRRGGRSILVTVQSIDSQVEELLQEFTRRKATPIEVLQALDKIRGMLVDMLV